MKYPESILNCVINCRSITYTFIFTLCSLWPVMSPHSWATHSRVTPTLMAGPGTYKTS